jgi:hypothetical protein
MHDNDNVDAILEEAEYLLHTLFVRNVDRSWCSLVVIQGPLAVALFDGTQQGFLVLIAQDDQISASSVESLEGY